MIEPFRHRRDSGGADIEFAPTLRNRYGLITGAARAYTRFLGVELARSWN